MIGAFFKVPVSGMAKSVLFLLFMFGIGYSVGPKFFKAMKGEGWRFGVIGVVVPVVGLGHRVCGGEHPEARRSVSPPAWCRAR